MFVALGPHRVYLEETLVALKTAYRRCFFAGQQLAQFPGNLRPTGSFHFGNLKKPVGTMMIGEYVEF